MCLIIVGVVGRVKDMKALTLVDYAAIEHLLVHVNDSLPATTLEAKKAHHNKKLISKSTVVFRKTLPNTRKKNLRRDAPL